MLLSPVASDRFILVMLARDGFVGREEKKWPSFQITSPGPIRGGVPENRKRKRKSSFQFAFPETGSYSYSSESMRTKYA